MWDGRLFPCSTLKQRGGCTRRKIDFIVGSSRASVEASDSAMADFSFSYSKLFDGGCLGRSERKYGFGISFESLIAFLYFFL